MWTQTRTWIKDKWLRFRRWLTGFFMISAASAAVLVINANVPDLYAEYDIPLGQTYIEMKIDRTQFSKSGGEKYFAEMKMEISLDGGKTWGGVWVDTSVKPHILYPLEIGAVIPNGEAIGPDGKPATVSTRGTDIPQPKNPNRKARITKIILNNPYDDKISISSETK